MSSDALRRSALAALRSGRVRVVFVRSTSDLQLTEVVAQVRSSREGGPRYAVDFTPAAGWSCTCNGAQECAHVHAAQLVTTGVPS